MTRKPEFGQEWADVPDTMDIHAMTKPACWSPSLQLLAKLGAIAVRAAELFSHDPTRPHDMNALGSLLIDPEVVQWLEDMGPLVPSKRNP